MSNQPTSGPGNGPPSAGMGMQHQGGGGSHGAPPAGQNLSQQNLNQIVRAPIDFVFAVCHVHLLELERKPHCRFAFLKSSTPAVILFSTL